MAWKPIDADTPRDRLLLLGSNNPKARYAVVLGRWKPKFREWQSEPGAWPMFPTHWMNPPDKPE